MAVRHLLPMASAHSVEEFQAGIASDVLTSRLKLLATKACSNGYPTSNGPAD